MWFNFVFHTAHLDCHFIFLYILSNFSPRQYTVEPNPLCMIVQSVICIFICRTQNAYIKWMASPPPVYIDFRTCKVHLYNKTIYKTFFLARLSLLFCYYFFSFMTQNAKVYARHMQIKICALVMVHC